MTTFNCKVSKNEDGILAGQKCAVVLQQVFMNLDCPEEVSDGKAIQTEHDIIVSTLLGSLAPVPIISE